MAERLKNLDQLRHEASKLTGKGKPGRKKEFTDEELYQRKLQANRQASLHRTKKGQDIGHVPEVTDKNWKRRLRCLKDPELFLQTYFGFKPFFWRPFSSDHLRVIEKAEHVTNFGGNAAYAMSRGDGKTTISRGLTVKSVIAGARRFAFFIGAADPHARRSLVTIKTMLERSPLLAEDFPEIIYPILKLEGQSKRQGGQTCLGELTGIHWGSDFIRLPTVPPQKTLRPEQGGGFGALVMCSGLLGSGITGMNVNGERPDLVVLDDIQTRASAKSDAQSAQREEIVNSIVQGIAAPGTRLAVFMPCTIIREGDTSSRFLDHKLHPEFAIERCKMLKSMPKNMELWAENKAIRTNYDPYAGPEDKHRAEADATIHYINNQAAMDFGAEASWKERFNDDEVSAIQHAMNKHADDRFSFFAEMQNEPLPADLGNVEEISKQEASVRLSNRQRLTVPHGATKLTAYIDVQGIGLLWYLVSAWKDDFTGWAIDYGAHPDQGRRYFTKSGAPNLLPAGDQSLHTGIMTLAKRLLTTQYANESGGSMMLDLCLIDSGHQTDLVYEACRQLQAMGFGNRIMPSKGEGTKASDRRGFNEGPKAEGEERGFGWKLPLPKEKRGVKLLLYDTNAWKSFVMDRIAVKDGGKSSLTFFGSDPKEHMMLMDHIFSEYRDRQKSERTGREIDMWFAKPNQDNDLWDALCGSAAAASVKGVVLEGVHKPIVKPPPSKGRRSWAEMQAKAMAR